MKISILIPVHNEARTLLELISRVQNASLPENCSREVIVIDDGSNDGTASLLKSHVETGIVQVVSSDQNRGKGAAIRLGLAVATGNVILIQDGDLEYDPNDYKALLTPIVQGYANVVYGSRFLGIACAMRQQNRIANQLLTATTNLLYGAELTDEATGYKAFRTEVLKSLALQSEGFEFCSEVTAKALRVGHRIHEVPIRYHARTLTEGKKIRAKDGFKAWWTLVQLRFAEQVSTDEVNPVLISSASTEGDAIHNPFTIR